MRNTEMETACYLKLKVYAWKTTYQVKIDNCSTLDTVLEWKKKKKEHIIMCVHLTMTRLGCIKRLFPIITMINKNTFPTLTIRLHWS